MTVTTEASVKVLTTDLRRGLAAVLPHVNKRRREDAIVHHRVRLVFALGELYMVATDGTTAAVARAPYTRTGETGIDDTRGDLWEPDDGPMIVDIQPRQADLIVKHFSVQAAGGPEVDQLMAIDVDTKGGEIRLEDIGGLWSAGEYLGFSFDPPEGSFPDVLDAVGTALAGVAGAAERGKPLVQDGQIFQRFKVAAKIYQQPLQLVSTGTAESRGFVALVGSNFVGAFSSNHADDDTSRQREQATRNWLGRLRPGKLSAA